MTEPMNTAKAEMLIRKPVTEVFEAFINPEITTRFWFTHSSGPLQEGEMVTWTWEMYNLDILVHVKEIRPNERIIIEWGEGKQKSRVKWMFKPLGLDKTFLTIVNYDLQGSGDELVKQIIDSTGGFTLVIAGLKAWLEHGIELDLIGDKFPKELMGE